MRKKRNRTALSLLVAILFVFSIIFPAAFSSAQANGNEYKLEGWKEKTDKWTSGELNPSGGDTGYKELEWVPFRVVVNNYKGNETSISISHDYQQGDCYGFWDVRNFKVVDITNGLPGSGDTLYDESDGIFTVTASTSGGNLDVTFEINDVDALKSQKNFALYWEAQLAGPNEASRWPGSSLHTVLGFSVGKRTVSINVGGIEPLSDPEIALEKSGPETAEPGDTITYIFTVTNTGNVDLTDVTVTDPLFGSEWSHTVGDLAVGASVSFDEDYTIPGEADGGPITNNATATGFYGDDYVTGSDTHTVTVVYEEPDDNPGISLEKQVSIINDDDWEDADSTTGPRVRTGRDVFFRFLVTNTGDVNLYNITLEDSDFDLSGVSTSVLEPGETFTYIYGPVDAERGQHTNTATATGEYNQYTYEDTDRANYYGYTRSSGGGGKDEPDEEIIVPPAPPEVPPEEPGPPPSETEIPTVPPGNEPEPEPEPEIVVTPAPPQAVPKLPKTGASGIPFVMLGGLLAGLGIFLKKEFGAK